MKSQRYRILFCRLDYQPVFLIRLDSVGLWMWSTTANEWVDEMPRNDTLPEFARWSKEHCERSIANYWQLVAASNASAFPNAKVKNSILMFQ